MAAAIAAAALASARDVADPEIGLVENGRKDGWPQSLAFGTAAKAAGPAPSRRACTRDGCSKTTTGVWTAYQHWVAVHGQPDVA